MRAETVAETTDKETVAMTRVGDILGYARVSTADQSLDAQRERLTEAGAIRIFTDVVSGKRFDRPGLAELIDHARPGDRLCITRLDRLGRSLKELLETVDKLNALGIHFVSLEEHLDTSSAAGELVFHVFGSIAHFERRLISERTRDGIAARPGSAVEHQGAHRSTRRRFAPRRNSSRLDCHPDRPPNSSE